MHARKIGPDELDELVAGDRFAPEKMTGAERAAWDAFDPGAMPDAVEADIPDWCIGHFQAGFSEEWLAEAQALGERPTLDLRVNRLKARRGEVLEELAPHRAAATALSPDGIRVPPAEGSRRHPKIEAEPAFLDGRVEIQDEGSQLAALLAAARGGQQVLDLCAGGGGKTLALAACLGNRGQIHAYDADRRRLAPIHDRLQRAGCRNVQVLQQAADLAALAGRMDLVLVDAPCTGSGTWRRHPDTKWRLTPAILAQRQAEQRSVLHEGARHVRPGGCLAYVTCSVLPAENEEQIEAFLSSHPEFRPVDHEELWRGMVPDHPERAHFRNHGLQLTPRRSGTDGFFVSIMRRQLS